MDAAEAKGWALREGRQLERELAEVRGAFRRSDAENDELRQENGALSAASAIATRSRLALDWCFATFGEVALCEKERSARFLEESAELVHALGLPLEIVRAIVDRVYSREKGDAAKEIGQAQLCLEVLGEVLSIRVDQSAAAEFDRIRAIPQEHWTRRHEEKVALGIANVAERSGGESA